MSNITLVCEVCKKEFQKPRNEYNRRTKLGKTQFYCGLSCSGKSKDNKKKLEQMRKLSTNDISKFSDNRKDEFSPFRETMRRVNNRKYKRDIDISLEDLKNIWESQSGVCPFTGWDMELPTQSKNYVFKPSTASLDRIDNSKGYTKDNVRFVSAIFNFARNVFSDEDVIDFANSVTNNKTMGTY